MSKKKKIEPLTGEELLQKVKELENLSKEEKAKACGYYTVTKNGIERVNMMKFLNALIDAEGIELDSTAHANGRGGRSASYRISVQSNGNLLIGSAYTNSVELNKIKETLKWAETIARYQLDNPNFQTLPKIKSQEYKKVKTFYQKTADISPEKRAIVVKRIIERAKNERVQSQNRAVG